MSASLIGDNSLGVTAEKANSWPKSGKGWQGGAYRIWVTPQGLWLAKRRGSAI